MPEPRTAENYPYKDWDPKNGIRPVSFKRWIKDGGEAKPRKALERGEGPKTKPYKKPAGQAEYEKAHTRDELFDVLDYLAFPEWLRFYALNREAPGLWERLESHHVFRRQYGSDSWNCIRAYEGCHKFCHSAPKLGRLACVIAKDRAGTLDLEAAKKRLGGKNPLGLLKNDLDDGVFTGPARDAAQALCERHGLA